MTAIIIIIISCTGKEFHFGERDSAPAKPKRDWSSLSQEYTTEENQVGFFYFHNFYKIVIFNIFLSQGNCTRNFKWPSMQSWQCPFYSGILKSFVWSSNNYISTFTIFEKPLFQLWVLNKSNLWISTEGKHIFSNDNIFHIIDKIKGIPALMWIGH